MTEYELMDLIGTWKADLLANATFMVTILFGYILAAYFVGAKLTRTQVVIISVLTLWQSLLTIYQIFIDQQTNIYLLESLRPVRGDAADSAVRGALMSQWVVIAGALASVFAAFYFMWTIRHPKPE